MGRNAEIHFGNNPTTLDIQRSKFKIPFDHKTTFNEGELIPFFESEVLPADTIKCKLSALVRMSTPIFPVLDNAYLDTYFFFIPYRLVWSNFKVFMGENDTGAWTNLVTKQIPQITAPTGGWNPKTLADYFGIPTKLANISINALPFRAYATVYNEWFRNENLIAPVNSRMDDATVAGSNSEIYRGGKPAKVGRLNDYFSTALPTPQKGPDVFVNLGGTAPLLFATPTNTPSGTTAITTLDGKEMAAWGEYYDGTPDYVETRLLATDGTTANLHENKAINLKADLSQSTGMTINELRMSFAIQRMYEKDARGGTRYREIIRSHFSTIVPDYRVQVPEYLGGKRVPINMTQVVQTSETAGTPQGNTSAYSLTIDTSDMFSKSFTEHGIILGLCCVRVDRTYQQGIERFWSRKDREDFYFPSLANIGEQAIKNKEIYAQGTSADEEVFGYQEAWAEYRYKPNRVSGEFRSNYTTPLDTWHYADYYTSQPILGQTWYEESDTNIARTLAVTTQSQFLADFYVDTTWVRPLPMYSIPGLIDHH